MGRLGGNARAKKLTGAQLKKIAEKGAKARAKTLTADERRAIARKAGLARWRKK